MRRIFFILFHTKIRPQSSNIIGDIKLATKNEMPFGRAVRLSKKSGHFLRKGEMSFLYQKTKTLRRNKVPEKTTPKERDEKTRLPLKGSWASSCYPYLSYVYFAIVLAVQETAAITGCKKEVVLQFGACVIKVSDV